MDEKTLDWRDLRLFLAVAQEGGLSPAARATGCSPATVGRRMLALERAMGGDLFVRRERGYELTEEGVSLRDALMDVEGRILRLTRRDRGGIAPLVKISAGTWTTLALLREAAALIGDPPDLRLRFVASESVLSIVRREVAIGLRNARPTEEGLAGRQLAAVEFAPYATPDAPDRWIATRADTPSSRWLRQRVGEAAAFEVTSPRNALDLALAGAGKALLPTFVGDREATLVRRAGPIDSLRHDQWIVFHQEERYLPEVRRAIDRIVAVVTQGPR